MALDPKTFSSIIDAHIGRAKEDHAQWDKSRKFYQCRQWENTRTAIEESSLYMEGGHLYAFVDSMVSTVVPPNPRVTCVPKRADARDAAKYREALINDTLYRTDASKALWQLSTHASVYPRGILKAVWNHRLQRPDFLVIDPRYFFFDLSAHRWEDSRYAIEVTTLTKAEFMSRVKGSKKTGKRVYDGNVAKKAQFGAYPEWLTGSEGDSPPSDKIRKVFEWVTIFEVWDFTVPGGRYYHFLQGQKQPLYADDPPYVFLRNPYHLTVFNDNLADIGGLSDASIVEKPMQRLDELNTLKLRFAQSTIPVTVMNEELVDDPEQFGRELSNATSPGDVARLRTKKGEQIPIDQVLSSTPTASLSPAFADMEMKLQEEILFRLGMPQYSRGVTGGSDVATELALVDASLRTRQGRRSSVMNAAVKFMAKATIGLYEEFLSPESTLALRLGKREYLELQRKHLNARNPVMAEKMLRAGEAVEPPLDIDYEVVPYSPVENSKTAQLKKVSQFIEILMASEHIDSRKLYERVVELLDLGEDLMLSEEDAQKKAQEAAQAMQAEQEGPGSGGQNAGGIDPSQLQTTTEQSVGRAGLPPSIESPVDLGAQGPMVGGAGFPTPEG